MKIAVLLYGHLRDFEVCADALNKNLLSRYDSDVFIHTWDERDHSSKCWHEQRMEATKVDEHVVEIIKTKYNPKGLIVEHQEKYAQEKLVQYAYTPGVDFSTAGPHYMFYSMNKAKQMRLEYENEEGVKYDYVFVTRPDVRLKTPFNIELYINEANVLGLDLDICRFAGSFEDMGLGGICFCRSNDLISFARPKVIDRYIEANQIISDEDRHKYGLTAPIVYTAKEIRSGNMLIPLTYSMSKDWDFSAERIKKEINGWKKVLLKMGVIFLWPVFRLQKKYRLLNYYEYKEVY